MKIYVDYYIKDGTSSRLMHTLISEKDIFEILEKQFREGELACPIHFNKETCEVSFDIAEVRV